MAPFAHVDKPIPYKDRLQQAASFQQAEVTSATGSGRATKPYKPPQKLPKAVLNQKVDRRLLYSKRPMQERTDQRVEESKDKGNKKRAEKLETIRLFNLAHTSSSQVVDDASVVLQQEQQGSNSDTYFDQKQQEIQQSVNESVSHIEQGGVYKSSSEDADAGGDSDSSSSKEDSLLSIDDDANSTATIEFFQEDW